MSDKLGAGENRMTAGRVGRFRKRYRPLSDVELKYHDAIKDTAAKLEHLIAGLGVSRELSIAIQHLESVVIWSVKDLTGERQVRSRDFNQETYETTLNTFLDELPNVQAD